MVGGQGDGKGEFKSVRRQRDEKERGVLSPQSVEWSAKLLFGMMARNAEFIPLAQASDLVGGMNSALFLVPRFGQDNATRET